VEGIQRADCGSNLQRAVDMAGQHLFSELATSTANLQCTTGWAGMARWKLGGIGVFRLACARLRVCAPELPQIPCHGHWREISLAFVALIWTHDMACSRHIIN
jgi:hypothetical protein